MRLSRPGPTNATLSVPDFGEYLLVVETVGYGISIATQADGVTRNQRTFYPFVRTSGKWYIEAVFPDVELRNAFHNWLLWYNIRAHNPYERVLPPITVIVPSEDFMKVGYPDDINLAFGDRMGEVIYRSIVSFSSASDPMTVGTHASRYHVAQDNAAQFFHPAGVQEAGYTLPPPVGWTPPSVGSGRRPLIQ